MMKLTDVLNQLFHIDGFFELIEISLALNAAVVNQEVGVSNHARHSNQNVLVHLVELAGLLGRYKQLGKLFLLCGQNNS